MPKPTRIGHLVINAKDLAAATKFYDLAIFQAPEGAADTADGDVGLNHMAIEVADFEELTEYYHKLQSYFEDSELRTTDHGMTRSIYIKDPEGNGIELFCNSQEDPADGLALMRSPERKNTELVFD